MQGTCGCHALWFEYGILRERGVEVIPDDRLYAYDISPHGEASLLRHHNGKIAKCQYTTGAQRIAKLLGFDEVEDLEAWADEDQVNWPYMHGAYMFQQDSAFTDTNVDLTLKHLHAAWVEAARLAAKREQEERA